MPSPLQKGQSHCTLTNRTLNELQVFVENDSSVSNELEANAPLAEQMVKMLTGQTSFQVESYTAAGSISRRLQSAVGVESQTENPRQRPRHLAPSASSTVRYADHSCRSSGHRSWENWLVGEHGAAVLTWLVRGAVEWNRHGLGSASAVKTATAAYRDSEDSFAEFLAERTIRVERLKTKVGDVYEVGKRWCEKPANDLDALLPCEWPLKSMDSRSRRTRTPNSSLVYKLPRPTAPREHEPTLESEGS